MRARGVDYFENSRRATYVQQQYAIENPQHFTGYHKDCWGITASDGPGPATLSIDGVVRQFYDYVARRCPGARTTVPSRPGRQWPSLRTESAATERRAVLSKIMSETFDFEEMARRTLDRHWSVRTPAERVEFVGLLAGLLERAYLSKVDQYTDAQITYVGTTGQRDDAIVRTKIGSRLGTELPVDYHVHRRGEDWLIHDVVIDGVSVVDNYRAQFNEIIQTSSYSELVAKMQALEGGEAARGDRSR